MTPHEVRPSSSDLVPSLWKVLALTMLLARTILLAHPTVVALVLPSIQAMNLAERVESLLLVAALNALNPSDAVSDLVASATPRVERLPLSALGEMMPSVTVLDDVGGLVAPY